MAEGEVLRVSARVQVLRDEAVSKEHQLFHFPNPFCDTCNRAKLLARRVRRKARPDHEPDEHSASCFGEVIAADHIHVYRSPDSSSSVHEYVVLCIRDTFTGLFAAFPCTDRSTDSVVVALRKFVGRREPQRLFLCCPMPRIPLKLPQRSWVGFIALLCPAGSRIILRWSVRFVRLRKVFVPCF